MLWLLVVPLVALAAAALLMPYETLRESRRCALRLDGTHSERRAHAEARARRALVFRMAVLPALLAIVASFAAYGYLSSAPQGSARAELATSAEDAALLEAELLREVELEAARRADREMQSLGLEPIGEGSPEASGGGVAPGFAPGLDDDALGRPMTAAERQQRAEAQRPGAGPNGRAPLPGPATAEDLDRALAAEAGGLSPQATRAVGTSVVLGLVLLALVGYIFRSRQLYRTDLRNRRKRYYHADTERLATAPPAL